MVSFATKRKELTINFQFAYLLVSMLSKFKHYHNSFHKFKPFDTVFLIPK